MSYPHHRHLWPLSLNGRLRSISFNGMYRINEPDKLPFAHEMITHSVPESGIKNLFLIQFSQEHGYIVLSHRCHPTHNLQMY